VQGVRSAVAVAKMVSFATVFRASKNNGLGVAKACLKPAGGYRFFEIGKKPPISKNRSGL
jgi:hypothetical protein